MIIGKMFRLVSGILRIPVMFFLPQFIFAQTTETADQKKIGFSFSTSINLLSRDYHPRNNPYPYSQYLTYGVDPILDYNSKLYKNSFHDALILPQIEINYSYNSKFVHSLGIGYVRVTRSNNYSYITDLASSGFYKNFYLNYQLTAILGDKTKIIRPSITVMGSAGFKKLFDKIGFENSPTDTIIDRSSLFSIQLPLGFIIHIEYFLISINSSFNLFSIVSGTHSYYGGNIIFIDEMTNYFKVLLIDKIIADSYFLSHIQFKIGYYF